MVRGRSGAGRGPRCYFLIVASAAAVIITSSGADAQHHSSDNRINRDESANRRNTHAQEYLPPSASIVVDGNSGAVLEASNSDALRHPASLTKIMTLYLLFERLERGRIHLDTPLKVSEYASKQAPTKLGLQAGQTITVEDVIKSMVTKSANDAAVVVAENLGGDEGNFAKLMTQKARALGMTRTTYMNASGLPDDDQVTTARDQALLGRAIQEHFPRYYKYFSTESFVYHGETMRNHNHLLGSIEGGGWHQDRLYPRLGLQPGDLGASRRTLSRRGRDGRPFILQARRPYVRTNQRPYQASRSPARGARHCPA
jgi:D-alanyl-D-alanine carboxypeptidase